MLESGCQEESGVLKERGKVVKWSLENVSATKHLKQEREELAAHLREREKRFVESEEEYEHLLIDSQS